MWNFLEKIRQKPEYIRKQIGFTLAVILTVFILFVWQSIDQVNSVVESPTTSPFSSIKDSLGEIAEKLQEIKDEAEASILDSTEVYSR